MTTSDDLPHQQTKFDLFRRGATAVAIFVVAAVAADGWQITRSERLGLDGSTVAAVLSGTVAWGTVVAGASVILLSCLACVGRVLARRARSGRRLRAAMIVAAPFAAGLWIGTDATLSGPGARQQPWIDQARIGAAGASVLAPVIVAWIVMVVGAAGRDGWLRRLLVLGSVAALPVAIYGDATVYPSLYPEFHLLLWLVVFAASVVAGVLVLTRVRRWGPAVALAALLATVVHGWHDPLAHSMTARAVAYRDTLMLGKALTWLAPTPQAEAVEVDEALLAQLALSAEIDPQLLDGALPGRRTFNVLLLGVDALRVDRLGRSNYRRKLTPNLDRLLEESVVFSNAWTAYPHTTYGMGALLQGLYPSSTDVWKAAPGTVLGKKKRLGTLQRLLTARGWRAETVTGMTPSFFRHGPTLQVDFDAFDKHRRKGALALKAMDASRVTSFLLKTIENVIPNRFFIWTHYFDPHAPYDPPTAEFGSGDQDRYDAEIAHVDRHVGKMLGRLSEYGLLDKTIIIVFADHGESFGEHNRPFHGTSLYEEQVHIPLAIRVPGLTPRTIQDPVDTVDLKPTILDLLDIETPTGLHGQSLLPFLLGMPAATHPPPYAFAELKSPRTFAVRDRRYKLILDADAQTYELFDLESDPAELRDVSASCPDHLERLQRVLAAFRALRRPR